MKWILIYIVLTGERVDVTKFPSHNTMEGCFDARERLVEAIGRPVVNYQAICVIEDNGDGK